MSAAAFFVSGFLAAAILALLIRAFVAPQRPTGLREAAIEARDRLDAALAEDAEQQDR